MEVSNPNFHAYRFFSSDSEFIWTNCFWTNNGKNFWACKFLLIYIMTGVWGNIFSFISGISVGAGASGALFGIAGSYAAYLYLNKDDLGKFGRESLVGLSWIVGINIIFGFTVSGIDNSAHLGGLISGIVIGYFLSPKISTIFISEFDSMEINTERKVSNQRPFSLWVIYFFKYTN